MQGDPAIASAAKATRLLCQTPFRAIVRREVVSNFVVDPGRRVYVRRINVSGNAQTRMKSFAGCVNWRHPGTTRARSSVPPVRLDRLGFFSEVTLDNQPVPGASDQVNIDVNVTEKNTGSLNAALAIRALTNSF